MRVFYIGNQIKGVCWDADISKLDTTQLSSYGVIVVDETANNPLTIDIERYWDRGKYYVQDGEMYMKEDWTEPVDAPPVVHEEIRF